MSKVGPPPPPSSYDSLGLSTQQSVTVLQPAMQLVTNPSAAGQWMAMPQTSVSCPQGLEYLEQLEQVFMQQQVEVSPHGSYGLYADSTWYKVLNSSGQQVYTAMEDSNYAGCCVCLPGQRGYNVNIKDSSGKEVMRIVRNPLFCSCCPCLGCEHHIMIECPPGQPIGYFRSQKGCGGINFVISNSSDEVVFTISFPSEAVSSPMQQQEFNFYSSDGSREVSKMTKLFNRVEFCYSLKNFTLSFPRDMDTRMKAVLMGTVFAIDVMYYLPLTRVRHM